MSNVLVLVEQAGGELKKTTLAGITFGQQVVEKSGGELHLVLIGKGVSAAAEKATGFGATKVHVVDDDAFEHYLSESYLVALEKVLDASGASVVAASSSTTTKELLARLAARRDAAMASDVLEVVDTKTFKRPMWAGNVVATVAIGTDLAVCTVRPTEFDAPAQKDGGASIEKHDVSVDLSSLKVRFVSLKESKSERPELSTASRIVSAGRGVKGPEGFALVEKLADALGAGVGASRAVCDAGWAPNDLQVGQTGKVVAPDLYVAVGISGAIQHIAGIKGSKVIVAINKDEEAPIFQVADYGLVADLFEAVPQLLEKIQS